MSLPALILIPEASRGGLCHPAFYHTNLSRKEVSISGTRSLYRLPRYNSRTVLMVCVQEAGPALHAPKEEEDEEQQDASVAAFSLEGAAAPAVTEVGTSDPVNDFVFMIKHDNLDKAFSGMPKAITSLVQNSMGDR